ncbi:MAG: hypothetical protein RBG13Loki_2410, partial [Promethearchaeota archaeon CR_4]
GKEVTHEVLLRPPQFQDPSTEVVSKSIKQALENTRNVITQQQDHKPVTFSGVNSQERMDGRNLPNLVVRESTKNISRADGKFQRMELNVAKSLQVTNNMDCAEDIPSLQNSTNFAPTINREGNPTPNSKKSIQDKKGAISWTRYSNFWRRVALRRACRSSKLEMHVT